MAAAVVVILAMVANPLIVNAQSGKVYRIGFLSAGSPSTHGPRVEAFRAGLRDLGYVEGKNILMEYRWAEGRSDRLPALAAELAPQRRRPDHRRDTSDRCGQASDRNDPDCHGGQ
jgi:hypothetical protein